MSDGITPRLDRLLTDLGREVEHIVLDVAGSPLTPMTSALRGRAMPRTTRSLSSVYPVRRGAISPLETLILDATTATWDRVLVAEADRLRGQLSARLQAAIDAGDDDLAELLRMNRLAPERRLAIARSLDDTRTWVDPNGYRLSDRAWNARAAVRQAIDQELRLGIVRGTDPRKLARSLRQYLTPVADGGLAEPGSNRGRGTHAARRLARTELTRARAQATVEVASRIPTTRGMRYHLGNSHPKQDQCCVAGTLIATESGYVPIEQIGLGTQVLTHKGRYRPVTQLHRSSVRVDELRVLRIQGETGRTHQAVMTRNHPVLTDQGWISAGDLRKEDRPVVLDGWLSEQPVRRRDDDECRASQGSVRSAHAAEPRSDGVERRDEDEHRAPHRHRMRFPGAPLPTVRLLFAFDTDRSPLIRLSSWDCHPAAVIQRAVAASPACSSTSLGGASHNWGWLIPTWARSDSSNAPAPSNSRRERSPHHRWGMCEGTQHGPLDSTHRSSTFGHVRSGTACSRIWCNTRRTLSLGVSFWQRLYRPLNRTVAWQTRKDASHHSDLASSRFRTARMSSSCINYSMVAGKTTNEVGVFNFAVRDDHSYVAEGVVVHNCDVHATADRYGLGPGGYPVNELPPIPQHPWCGCYTTSIFPSREESDRIIRARYGLGVK